MLNNGDFRHAFLKGKTCHHEHKCMASLSPLHNCTPTWGRQSSLAKPRILNNGQFRHAFLRDRPSRAQMHGNIESLTRLQANMRKAIDSDLGNMNSLHKCQQTLRRSTSHCKFRSHADVAGHGATLPPPLAFFITSLKQKWSVQILNLHRASLQVLGGPLPHAQKQAGHACIQR